MANSPVRKWRMMHLQRSLLFVLFVVCAVSIFGIPLLLSEPFELVYRIIICVVFGAGSIAGYSKPYLSRYFQVLLAFFVSSLVYTFEYLLYSNQSLLYWVSASRMDLFILFKVLSTLLVVIPIVALTKATGKDMASIFVSRGNLRLGLSIGLMLFLVFLATSVWTGTLLYGGKDLTFEKVAAWAPWVLVFVFSNGIKEEIQFRGLFLKKYKAFFRVGTTNLLQALPFAVAHLGETYSPLLIVFFVIVFLLGLGFGALAQKTNSLIGSILFHAGTDIPVILGIFSNF